MIILFMGMFTKWVLLWLWFVILAGLYSFRREQTYVGIHMDNFGRQNRSDGQFCASDTQTHRHTDTQTHRHTDRHTDRHTLNLYIY